MQINGSKIIGTCQFSQDKTQLWSFDYSNNSFQTLLVGDKLDPIKPGWNIEYGIAVDNGNVVGVTRNGSAGGAGSIFSHNLTTGQDTILKSKGSREGRAIIGELTQLNDSIFIGYIGKGGPNASGNQISQDEQGSLALFNLASGTIEHLENPFVGFNDGELVQSNWMNKAIMASNGKL